MTLITYFTICPSNWSWIIVIWSKLSRSDQFHEIYICFYWKTLFRLCFLYMFAIICCFDSKSIFTFCENIFLIAMQISLVRAYGWLQYLHRDTFERLVVSSEKRKNTDHSSSEKVNSFNLFLIYRGPLLIASEEVWYNYFDNITLSINLFPISYTCKSCWLSNGEIWFYFHHPDLFLYIVFVWLYTMYK